MTTLETEFVPGAEAPRNPEAPASPEDIALVHEALVTLIETLPEEYHWPARPSQGINNSMPGMRSIRFLSQPASVRTDGSKWGESFSWINYFRDEQGKLNIMVTEDQGSGNPWGDVLGSLEAGAIVRKIYREDMALTSPSTAIVRKSNFTFGPARLEEAENAAQVNNPFVPATNKQIDRIGQILVDGIVYPHDGDGKTPQDWADRTLPVADILLHR